MTFTLYDSTIVVVQGILKTLTHILHEAEKRPNASTLLEARLHEDMYPLTEQIRIATQYSENLIARLTVREPVTFDRDLTTFAKCFERIETVLKAFNEAEKDVVNGQADVLSPTQLGPKYTIQMSAAGYAHTVVLPNVYFHVTTAYGILRKEGVPIGKRDFYAGFFPIS